MSKGVLKSVAVVHTKKKIQKDEPRAALRIELPKGTLKDREAALKLTGLLSKARVEVIVEEAANEQQEGAA